MPRSGAVDSPVDYSANEPSPQEHEKLLSDSDPQSDEAPPTGKMTKYPRMSRESSNHERERFTYEHMLVRYGSWYNLRGPVLAYVMLILIGFIYKAHVDSYTIVAGLHTINEGRHIHCCCEKPARAEYLEELDHQLNTHGAFAYFMYLVPIIFSLSAPLWERYIGRRKALLAMLLAGIPCSLLLLFTHPPERLELIHVILNFIMVGTMWISMVNLSEMLPYNIRYISVSLYPFVGGFASALTAVHFHRGFSLLALGILCAAGFSLGAIIVIFATRDSICHLNLRNNADLVEKIIRKEELILFKRKPEGDIYYHTRVARKIFEDLVYMDRDELKLINFLKRLWRNPAIIEIFLTLFQGISAGLHEFELNRFRSQLFVGAYMIGLERVLGFLFTPLVMMLLRRIHRVKALSFMLAAALLIAASRHAIVNFDFKNRCALNEIPEPQYSHFVFIFTLAYLGFGACIHILILIHFIETTPSMLRLTCLSFVYLPAQGTALLGETLVGSRINKRYSSSQSAWCLAALYSYHLIIIVVTSARGRSKLPFSLYLFDLMPGRVAMCKASGREEGSDRVETSLDEGTEAPPQNRQPATVSKSKPEKAKIDQERKKFDPIASVKNMMKRKK